MSSDRVLRRPAARRLAVALVLLLAFVLLSRGAAAQQMGAVAGQRKPTPTPKAGALIDLTGYWVSIIDDEWRWRMMTPPKGDFSFVPLNAEGRRVALHITWVDDNTLAIDIDAGMQKRLLHFDGSKWNGGEPQWQGDSVASWEKQAQSSGFGRPVAGAAPPVGGSVKVVTTHMRSGYLRKNGVPYSGNAVLTEHFDRLDVDGQAYLIVTGIVEDPQYLTGRFMTTEQFKLEPNGSKWNPAPCKIAPPTRAPARAGGL
jgi:hypothetical protein